MNFKQNHFEIFGLPVGFAVNLLALEARYLELQREVHPDRHAAGSEAEQRLAMQWAAQVNTARATLTDPLQRAIYLLQLHGCELEENPDLPPTFLMEQIALRESLDDLVDGPDAMNALGRFKQQVKQVMSGLEDEFAEAIASSTKAAETVVYKMQFMNKLLLEANQRTEAMLTA